MTVILTADFLNTQYSNYAYPLILKPTRVTTSSVILTDNTFTNSLHGDVLCSGIIYSDTSHHFSIFYLTLSARLKFQEIRSKKSKKISDCSMIKVLAEIGEISQGNLYSHDDPDSAYQSFIASITSAFN